MTADMVPWIVASIPLLLLVVAMIASSRSQRQLGAAHEESIATKNEQIATLEAQLASLRESESVRFVDRYIGAKNGLEERVRGLQEQLDAAREQQKATQSDLADLGLSDQEREREGERLQRDLMMTNDQIRRLNVALREVASVGPVDVAPIQVELDNRNELAEHIQERLDRLNLEGRERMAIWQNRTKRLEGLNEEVARLRREIEVTRAASSIVDGVLGIDSDTRKRLSRHASDRIEGALQSLGDAAKRNPISRFVDVLEQQRSERLLESGKAAPPPSEPPKARDEAGRAEDRPATVRVNLDPAVERAGSRPEDAGAEEERPEAPTDDDTAGAGSWTEREPHQSPSA